MGTLTFSEMWIGVGREKAEEAGGGEKLEMNLACKIRKYIFKKMGK